MIRNQIKIKRNLQFKSLIEYIEIFSKTKNNKRSKKQKYDKIVLMVDILVYVPP